MREDSNTAAMRKLMIVSSVSVIFIVVQLIGGYMAKSIAIFTDSAHLASDLIGFAISIFSLKQAQRPADKSLSFGYHRAEVIGTLVSIIFIWGLTVWLVQEATMRIIDPQEVVGGIMLIVAILGLIFNLIQMKILHSGDGHYHLGGSHDHDDHDHDHGHSHGHSHKKKEIKTLVVDQTKTEQLVEGLLVKEEHTHEPGHKCSHKHEDKHDHDHKHDHGHKHDHDHDHKHDQEHDHDHDHKEDHKHSHDHKHDHDHDHGHSHSHEKQESNINITSAYLHVLGDMLMSVGVIIAALVIYFKPEWNIADPICTYLFSVIVCFTTIPVFKDCALVLMEGTPTSIDIAGLEEDLLAVKGVDELHDFHVWSISVNKYALSAHIISETPLKTLSMVTDLCRRKYKLFHTTIQMEGSEESKHFFKCENDLHD